MPDPEMTPAQDVLAAHEWAPGACYRCGQVSARTAVVGRLDLEAGPRDIRACTACVLKLERDREKAAARYGWPYVPGELSS